MPLTRLRLSVFVRAIIPLLLLLGGFGCVAQPVARIDTDDQTPAAVEDTRSSLVLAGRYADPDIIQMPDGSWRLYLGVEPEVQGTRFEIYTATSQDGRSWTLREQPVLTGATFPDAVVLPDGRVRLYFQSGGVIVSAISQDGVAFVREPGVRVGRSGLLDSDNVAAPSVVERTDGSSLMAYRAVEAVRYRAQSINPTTTALILATSQDGIDWDVGDVIVDGRSDRFDGYVDGSELFYDAQGLLHLRFWSSGSFEDQAGTSGQYDMVSRDHGVTWSEPVLFSSILGGDPTYAVIGDALWMYFTVLQEGIFLLE